MTRLLLSRVRIVAIPHQAGRSQGQMLVLFAVGLAGFLGLVGMSVDIGRLAQTRTDLQRTADAAALAGAQELAQTTPNTSMATSFANQ